MMRKRSRLSFLSFLAFLLASCGAVSQSAYDGAVVGAIGGATAGAMIDRKNSWRGAVIGGSIGAFVGGSLVEIASRARNEAHATQKPVYYENVYTGQKVYAEPLYRKGECTLVRTTYYKNGRLAKVEEKEVCG